MQYEIVNMKEKTVAGFAARTNNSSADMRKTICGLWKRFYSSEGAALNAHKTIKLSEYIRTILQTKMATTLQWLPAK